MEPGLNTRRHPSVAPVASPEGHPALEEGRRLFNAGEHWYAHEAWEPLWMALEGTPKLQLQGLIMAAAMLVQYERRVLAGVQNHHANVIRRLDGVDSLWRLDVAGLRASLDALRAQAEAGTYAMSATQAQLAKTATPGHPTPA